MILTESPVTPTSTRERTAETVFEMFSAPSVAFASQTTLSLINSLYGPAALRSARIPRVVVESGYGATHVVPYAANGLPIENAIQSSAPLVLFC
jgi:actin-related protein